MIYKNKAFTLIEIMVVVAIVGLILPTLFAIIFTLLRLQVQISQLQRLKEVGDFVSNQMIYSVKQHAYLVDNSGCGVVFSTELTGSDSYVLFRDKSDYCFGFYVKNEELLMLAEPSAIVKEAILVSSTDTDFPVIISQSSITEINDRLAKISFTVKTEPKVSYLSTQTLPYQFFAYIRH